jgi:hypothetical protein
MSTANATKRYHPLLVNMKPPKHQVIASLAEAERRSKSQMAEILMDEALAARADSVQKVTQASA